jgi:hypothetical protein
MRPIWRLKVMAKLFSFLFSHFFSDFLATLLDYTSSDAPVHVEVQSHMFTTIAAISNLISSPKTKGSGDRNEERDDNVSPSPPSSSRPQFTSVVLADEDVIPRYNVSKLDELSKVRREEGRVLRWRSN